MTVLGIIGLFLACLLFLAALAVVSRAQRALSELPRAIERVQARIEQRIDLALTTAEGRFDNLAGAVTRQGKDAVDTNKVIGGFIERLRYFEKNDPRLKRLADHLDRDGEKAIGEAWLSHETEARQAARMALPDAPRTARRCPDCGDPRIAPEGAIWCMACGYANPGVSCRRCGRGAIAPDHLAPQGHVCFAPDPNFQTVPDTSRAGRLQASPTFAARSAHQCSS